MRRPERALNVAFVSQWFQPEPVNQPGWIVDGLRKRGADVTVLTGIPNYPSGQVAKGYRAWRVRNDVVDGIKVRRTPLFPSHDADPLPRIINYISWALSSTIFGLSAITRSDVVLVYSSPATAATAPLISRKLKGTPYVLLVQDLWPDSIFASGFLPGSARGLKRRLLDVVVNAYYKNASKILVTSPGMIGTLVDRGVPRAKLDLIYNWVPETQSPPERRDSSRLRAGLGIPEDAFVLMYAGNLGAAQGLDSVLRGMGHLGPEARVHLVLVGDGVEREPLTSTAASLAPETVHFVPPMGREALLSVMEEADAQLVSLARTPLFAVTMPSKVQSILAAGSPVLCCVDGDVADVVSGSGGGLVCRPGDPDAFAEAVLELRDMGHGELIEMGARGRAYYRAHMAQDVGVERLFGHLSDAAPERELREPAHNRGR